jgi:predicted nucleic acid-binding protein
MPATLYDIGDPNIPFPDFLILDASIILALRSASNHPHGVIVRKFLNRVQTAVRDGQTLAYLPYLALEECYFKICKDYLREQAGRGTHWVQYYKQNPQEISTVHPKLVELRRYLRAIPIPILEAEDLVATHRRPPPLSERMLAFVNRFQILPKDAAILADAERAGIYTVASLDSDWRRADGFTVITLP